MHTIQIVWLVLVVVFILLEGMTTTLISVWFCLGSIVALIVSLALPGMIVLQIALFLIVSIIAILALRPFAKKIMGNRQVATNADANIGKVGRVVNEIQPDRFGRVKLEGLEWTARANCLLEVGSLCKVEAIEGVKLVVVPYEDAPTPCEPGPTANQ